MSQVTCCEHNPCPDRPKWFLSRFVNRPWYCDQCGGVWVTEKDVYRPYSIEYQWRRLALKAVYEGEDSKSFGLVFYRFVSYTIDIEGETLGPVQGGSHVRRHRHPDRSPVHGV